MAKTDIQLNQNNRLTFRFNGHRNDSPYNGAGTLQVVSRSYNFVDRSYVFAAQLISVLNPTTVNEFRFQSPLRNQKQLAFLAHAPACPSSSRIRSRSAARKTSVLTTASSPPSFPTISALTAARLLKVGVNFRTIGDKYMIRPPNTRSQRFRPTSTPKAASLPPATPPSTKPSATRPSTTAPTSSTGTRRIRGR